MDEATLVSAASIFASFGTAMLTFRIQRELQMRREGEQIWLPWADWLIVAAVWICLLLVILPIVSKSALDLPAAATGTSAILIAGYVLAILAHYRIFFGRSRTGPRENPEPAERLITLLTFAGAVLFLLLRWSLSN